MRNNEVADFAHYTKTGDVYMAIDWERGSLVDTHPHEKHYEATGKSEDGRDWVGTWVECGGEIEIIDKELA